LAGQCGAHDPRGTVEFNGVVYGAVRGLCEPDTARFRGSGLGPVDGEIGIL